MSEPTVQTASEPVILTEKRAISATSFLTAQKLNAINWQVYREMIPAIEKMETDDDVKVVVLERGAGRCFSAGFDLSEPSFDDHEENRRMYERVAHGPGGSCGACPSPDRADSQILSGRCP